MIGEYHIDLYYHTTDPPTSIMKHHSRVEDFFRRHKGVIICMLNNIFFWFTNCLMLFVTRVGNLCSIFCSSFPVVMLLTVGLILTFSTTKYADITTLYRSDAIAVVANSSRAFSLEVTQDSSYAGDIEHEITLYRVKSKCSEQPTLTELKDNAQVTSINGTTIYAWTGSSITFHICGSTNQSSNFQRHLDVVIMRGLNEWLQFAETILPTFYQGLHFLPGTNGEWMCANKTVDINDPDYYTIILLPQSTADHFNYSVTYSIHTVDLSQLQHHAITATLYKNGDKWNVPEPAWFEYDICIFATFKNKYSERSQVHIRARYRQVAIGNTIEPGQATLLSCLLILSVGVTILCICNVGYCFRQLRKKNVSFTVSS